MNPPTPDHVPTAAPTADFAWVPSPEVVERSRLMGLIDAAGVADYAALVARAADDPEWFWALAVRDLDVAFMRPYSRVVDTSDGVEWARWWTGALLNVAHSAVERHRGTPTAQKTAIVWEGEAGDVRRLTYEDVDDQISRFAAGLQTLGVELGDRVGLFMPQVPEVVVAMLACAKIGAVIVPIFSGYGPAAVAERLAGCDAKVLICSDGFVRRGRTIAMKAVADEAVARCQSVTALVVHEHVGSTSDWTPSRDHTWASLLETGSVADARAMSPDDVLMIIYTSGTTGPPKGAVHVHGGFPIKGLADMVYGFDVQPDDVVFWFTDIGWMMAPWMAYGTLSVGATLVLFEGSPDTPDPGRLWRFAADHQITVFGLSPTLVRSLMVAGDEHVAGVDLPALRILGSTGERWDPEPWSWLFTNVGNRRVPIINYSGGTELAGGILCGNVLTPLRPTAFAGPLPGMAADVIDANGESVRGEIGELVLRGPAPGMTCGFWRDDERYLETYWRTRPGIWVHGDWARVDGDGLWYLLGRSDDTIKIAGKRLGPGEVEAAVGAAHDIALCVAFGIDDALKGESLACLLVPRAGVDTPHDQLEREAAERIVDALGKTFRPGLVAVVPDLPLTRNGKLVRRVAKAAFTGRELGDLSALENPGATEALREAGIRRRAAPSHDQAAAGHAPR